MTTTYIQVLHVIPKIWLHALSGKGLLHACISSSISDIESNTPTRPISVFCNPSIAVNRNEVYWDVRVKSCFVYA